MPVQTRGAARRKTEVQIRSLSATRKGKQTQWLQASNKPEVAEEERLTHDDPRFKTPSPPNGCKLSTPPKIERRPHHSNPVSSVEPTHPRTQSEEPEEAKPCGRNLYPEFQSTAQYPTSPTPSYAGQPGTQGLGSPFSGPPSGTFQSFSQGSNGECSHSHSASSGNDTEVPQPEAIHPQSTPLQARGLGRHDTVLLGPDGKVVVPGIREGY